MRLGQSRAYSVIVFVATVIVGQNIFRVCLSRDSFVVSIYFPFESMRIIMSSLLGSRVVVFVLMKWSGVRALSGELLTPDSRAGRSWLDHYFQVQAVRELKQC